MAIGGTIEYVLKLTKGSFDADVSNAKGKIQGLSTSAGNAAGSVDGIGASASSSADTILNVLGAAAVTATLAKIGSSLVDLAKDAAAVGDGIDKNSAKLGFSAESYQKWSFIMERSGSSIDSMGRSMNNLTQIMNGEGSDKAIAAFDALGISVDELSAMDTGDAFEKIIRSVMELDDTNVAKKGLLQSIFGTSQAGQYMSLINGGVQGLDDMLAYFEGNNLGISDEAIQKAVALTDSMTNLNKAAQTLKTEAGAVVAGVITPVVDSMSMLIGGVNGLLFGGQQSTGQKIAGIFDDLETSLSGIDINEAQLSGIIDYLDKLGDFGDLSPEDQQKWLTAAQELIDKCPELASAFDLETGSIAGGTQALRDNVTAMMEAAREKARQKALQGYYDIAADTQGALTQAAVDRGVAEKQNARLQQLILANFQKGDWVQQASSLGIMYDTNSIKSAQDVIDFYNKIGFYASGNELQALNDYKSNQSLIDGYDDRVAQLEAERDEAIANYEAAKATLENNPLLAAETSLKTSNDNREEPQFDTDSIVSAIANGINSQISGATVQMDGAVVGRIVSQYIGGQIGR